jgi:excisionase family DNA binding protein
MKDETIQTDFRPEPALWSIQQAAVYLGVSPRTIRNLITHGDLVRRKIGSRTLIPKTSLQSFLKRNHETQSKSDN